MSKKANTSAIGLFVIGAVLLAVAGVVIFGGGQFFTKKYNYVAYFSGSVKGLNIGAPVLFRGVKIWQVTGISMQFDAKQWISVSLSFSSYRKAELKSSTGSTMPEQSWYRRMNLCWTWSTGA
jgi:ABC-type transporter Mla subunit MlaD